ncbi:hypothetical protein DH2020_012508 [Rehmannia glutinosa]|uniref:Fatty acid hydroxylase domain-containing protein n=1 Tax=Rehmannia glutinosa TaxID=99300 RepID=A0ABR0X2Z0_REHGL
MAEEQLKLFVEETSWYNDIVLGSMSPGKWWELLPHLYREWLRNTIAGTLLYLVSSGLWCFYIYYLKRNVYFPKDVIPSKKAMLLQIRVSLKALPWYSALPTLSKYMIEHGWTKCFSRINDVGWVAYVIYLIVYLAIVEFGTCWVHRELHDIKFLYKHLHATHHIYNKHDTISPFAGMALHPLDGILQGLPHVVALVLVPMHFSTHIALMFLQGIWTANIHDCIHGKLWSVMGAGYHTKIIRCSV